MEPSDHDKISLCKILCSVGSRGLLVEWIQEILGRTNSPTFPT
jgi:hypothetical protein